MEKTNHSDLRDVWERGDVSLLKCREVVPERAVNGGPVGEATPTPFEDGRRGERMDDIEAVVEARPNLLPVFRQRLAVAGVTDWCRRSLADEAFDGVLLEEGTPSDL
jgi:hypothetical protein